jgi:hypothetical protein
MRIGSEDVRGGLESNNADACTSVPVAARDAFSITLETCNGGGAVRLVGRILLWPSAQQEWSDLWESGEFGSE